MPHRFEIFFSNLVSIIWLYFIQSQLKVVCDTILRIERDNVFPCQVSEKLEILCGKIKNRKTKPF